MYGRSCPACNAPAALLVGEDDGQAEREEADYVASLMPDATVHVLPGRSGLISRRKRRSSVTWLALSRRGGTLDAAGNRVVHGRRRVCPATGRHRRPRLAPPGAPPTSAGVRETLAQWDGKEHDTAGDGFFASFTGPARAIHCAREIAQRVARLGLETRAAVHIGECELIDGKPGGVAVTIAARALATAAEDEVIVTQTVKDLVAGSGFRFADHGEHDVKGVPDRWHLYAVAATTERQARRSPSSVIRAPGSKPRRDRGIARTRPTTPRPFVAEFCRQAERRLTASARENSIAVTRFASWRVDGSVGVVLLIR